MKKKKKIILYISFAIISSLANLLTQRIVLSILVDDLFFFVAIIFGTIVGLLIKFILDKNFIFSDNSKNINSLSKKFSIYSLMGIFSTIIFWGTETIFWIIWRQENMRELGALLGLTLGYIIKYRLDKKYVFREQKS